MKPQTKLHFRVMSLHNKLPAVTKAQKEWAYKKLFKYYAWKTKHKASCFECGHSWNEDTTLVGKLFDIKCPKCKKKLIIAETHHHSKTEIDYFCIFSIVDDFQIQRMFQVHHYCSKGYEAHYTCHEIYQHWLLPNGKLTTVARNVNALGFNYSGHSRWIYYQPMEIKNSGNDRYYIHTDAIHYKSKFHPILYRNGFSGEFYRYSPIFFFETLLTNQKFETLLKARQYSLMEMSTHRQSSVNVFWNQIKICMRHRYIVHDASSWFDYLRLLEYFKMDIHNPKYVCPANFDREHDELVRRKEEIMGRQRRAEAEKKEFDNKLFREIKKKLINLKFVEGRITIVPLKNVTDFKNEQKALNHCVYVSGYHKKDTSLIMSARIDNKRTETIEINLDSFKVYQCRGYQNKDSEYHSEILKLVEKSIPKLKSSFEKSKREVISKIKKQIVAA